MRRLLLTTTLGVVMLITSGCIFKRGDAKPVDPSILASTASSIGGLAGFKTSVYPFVRKNCIDCHGSIQSPLFAQNNVNDAYNAALGEVNFVEIPGSTFVKKVKDGHCGGPCSSDGSGMVKLIEDWKGAFKAGSGPGEAIPKGNIFTNNISIPLPDPRNCQLPGDLANSPDIPSQNTCWTKLRFPFSKMSPVLPASIRRAWFEVDFAYENYTTQVSTASYVIRNLRIVSPDVPIYVFDVKFFINNQYRPNYGEVFRSVDKVVDISGFAGGCNIPAKPTAFDPNDSRIVPPDCIPSVPVLFSTAASASGLIQERDPNAGPSDMISFSFEYLQLGLAHDCKDSALFDRNVYTPIKMGAVACLNCHRSGGQITEAGQRFNMDPNDPNNGATVQERLETVCKRFLQRANLQLPDSSPIIVQPRQGLNGMPPQDNFNYFAPNWLAWIEAEAKK